MHEQKKINYAEILNQQVFLEVPVCNVPGGFEKWLEPHT